MRALAHAKVNLGLRIGSVGPDGFHSIRSLFQSISWSDRLELVAGDEDGIAGWNGEEVPDGDANLARRAVVAMREAVGSTASMYLRLQKRIPVAAGLGGGSADAAAAKAKTRGPRCGQAKPMPSPIAARQTPITATAPPPSSCTGITAESTAMAIAISSGPPRIDNSTRARPPPDTPSRPPFPS